MNKRVRRKRHSAYRRKANMTSKILSVVIVIGISVLAGYMTANYVLGPMLGLESEPAFSDFVKEKKDAEKEKKTELPESETKVVEDQIPVQSEKGFALQYGSFSSKNGAQQCADELKSKGIETSIIEKDGNYKVIGKVFDTKEEARMHKNTSAAEGDIFVTEIP